MILLTREQAEAVLGPSPTHPERALEPVPLKDGTYILPDEVIDDEANADIEDMLSEHLVDGDPDPALIWNFGTPEDPDQEEIDAYNAARLNWNDGVAREVT